MSDLPLTPEQQAAIVVLTAAIPGGAEVAAMVALGFALAEGFERDPGLGEVVERRYPREWIQDRIARQHTLQQGMLWQLQDTWASQEALWNLRWEPADRDVRDPRTGQAMPWCLVATLTGSMRGVERVTWGTGDPNEVKHAAGMYGVVLPEYSHVMMLDLSMPADPPAARRGSFKFRTYAVLPFPLYWIARGFWGPGDGRRVVLASILAVASLGPESGGNSPAFWTDLGYTPGGGEGYVAAGGEKQSGKGALLAALGIPVGAGVLGAIGRAVLRL